MEDFCSRILDKSVLYVYSHICHSLMLIVVGLDVRCIYWCVSVYPLPFAYVAFVLSISLIHIVMLLLFYL